MLADDARPVFAGRWCQRRRRHELRQEFGDGDPATEIETGAGVHDESLQVFGGLGAGAAYSPRQPADLAGDRVRVGRHL